ncbi:MAG: hypothetical protein ACREKF_07015, partial [Candidatus Methylomirabilales bacterium]
MVSFYWLYEAYNLHVEPATHAGAIVRGLSPLLAVTFLVSEVLVLRLQRNLRWWVLNAFVPVLLVVVAGFGWLLMVAVGTQVQVPQEQETSVHGGILVVAGLLVIRAMRLLPHPGPPDRMLVDGMNLVVATLLIPLILLAGQFVVSDSLETKRAVTDPLSYDYSP